MWNEKQSQKDRVDKRFAKRLMMKKSLPCTEYLRTSTLHPDPISTRARDETITSQLVMTSRMPSKAGH